MLSELLISCSGSRRAAVLLHLTKSDTREEENAQERPRIWRLAGHCAGDPAAPALLLSEGAASRLFALSTLDQLALFLLRVEPGFM